MASVAVLGAAGGIGQPLSLLLKMNPLVRDLALYDVVNSPGVAADLSHICTGAAVKGFMGDAELKDALKGRTVVVIPAGVPRKPGMTRDDLFNINAGIIKTLATACAEACPDACFLIISNPVNSTVPIFAEVLKQAGCYNPAKLFGVTTLDLVRARTFVAGLAGADVAKVNVPVIGGHSGTTIIPVLSQCGFALTQENVEALTHRIQFGGDEVVQAKAGAGSATLSMAYAAMEFASDVLKALNGEEGIQVCTYIDAEKIEGVPAYFACQVKLGKAGIAEILPVPTLSEYEAKLLAAAKEQLTTNIDAALTWMKK